MNKHFTLNAWIMTCCLLFGALFFSSTLTAQSVLATRNVSNTTQCQNGNFYSFSIPIEGLAAANSFEWASFTEYSDGTATLIGTLVNGVNPDVKFNVDVTLTGRTFTAPAMSPKPHVCATPTTDDWYYYTGISGTLMGVGQCWGTMIDIVSNAGPAFQFGAGANITNDGTSFGASGWLVLEVSAQNSWGPQIVLNELNASGANGDINIDLSGSPLTPPGACDNVTNGGTISGDQTVCAGAAANALTGTTPTGGSGAAEYLWLSSTSSCPIAINQQIAGANGATYNPGVLNETTYFVRCSRRAGCDSWTQGESNCVTVTVDTDPACGNTCDNVTSSGTIGGTQTVCAGDAAATLTNDAAASGGSGNAEYLWLSSTTSCPTSLTQQIAGANGATYNPGVLNETTYFVRCSRRAGCDSWTQGESNCVTVTVDTDPTCGTTCDNVTSGGAIGGTQTICAGEAAATLTNNTAPSGGAGGVEYLWLSSTSSCPTTINQEIAGANGATYNPGVLNETTYFVRCSRRAGCDSWTQGESNCVTVTVDTDPACGGGGGGGDCADISITSDNGSIIVGGLDGSPVTSVQIFTSDWSQTILNCFGDCDSPTQTVSVSEGSYLVYVKYYTAGYSLVCEISETITVGGGGGGGCTDNDNDGVCAADDCDDNNASVPATVGSTCNDGNGNTTNDVIQADGCTCAGTPDGGGGGGGNGVDIKLNIIGDGAQVGPYASFSVDVFVMNEGTSTSNNVVVSVPQPENVVFSGGNASSATQGNYDPFTTFNWNVGTLTPGQSETLTINYFSLAGAPYTVYAQVQSASGTDIDSTPGNGTNPTPNEDDEDVYLTGGDNGGGGGGNPSCDLNLTANVSAITCDDNGTPDNANDDTFTFNVTVNGGNPWGWSGGGNTGEMGQAVSFGPYAISAGNVTFTVVDNDNETCTANVNVTPPATCSNGGGGGGGNGDCANITITPGNGNIVVGGLDGSPITSVQVFTSSWQGVFNCFGDCDSPTTTVPVPASGDYLVYVKYYTAGYAFICEVNETVTVGGGGGGGPTGDLSLTCPSNVNVSTAPGANNANANYTTPNASTTCTTGGLDLQRTAGPASGASFSVGTTTVTYQATDNCGNTETCSFTVTVTAIPAPATPCEIRTVSNASNQCDNTNNARGFYAANLINGTNSGNALYNVSNATLEEFEDGTAKLTAHYRNVGNSNIRWDAVFHLSGRTFDAPTNSPKASPCYDINGNDFYYYTSVTGTFTGTNAIAGAKITVSLMNEAMQFGTGANLYDQNNFGASAWFVYNIVSQPDNTARSLETGAQVDVNVKLTGGALDCQDAVANCSSFNYTGLDYMGTSNGRDYYVKPNGDVTYDVALALANASGGTLLTITSAAENNYIASLLNGRAWLGLTDIATEGQFVWNTGDAVTYTNWNTNEPNDYNNNEDYAQILTSGKWNDIRGTANGWAIIEFPACSLDGMISIQDDVLNDEAEERTEDEAVTATTFGIYPNPATDIVNVSLTDANGAAVTINVYDQLGRLVEHVEANATYESVYRINTSDFTSGMYLIRVQAGDAPAVTKQLVIMAH